MKVYNSLVQALGERSVSRHSMHLVSIALITGLCVSGCGSPSTVLQKDGTTVTVNSSGNAQVPSDLPVSVYPGAGVTTVAQTPGQAGMPSTTLILESADGVDKIADYYKNELGQKGWRIDQVTTSQGIAALTANKDGVQVTVAATATSGKTAISINVLKLK